MTTLYTMAKVEAAPVRRINTNGTDFAVIPTVVIATDRMNGEIVPFSEVERSTAAWDGVAVTLNHPSIMGTNVSVKDAPHFQIGDVRYPSYVSNKLRAELWVNLDQGFEVPGIVSQMERGKVFEVSSGYFANVAVNKEGEKVQSDIDPDHVAILLAQAGACSIEDGCGAPRTNACTCQSTKDLTMTNDVTTITTEETLTTAGTSPVITQTFTIPSAPDLKLNEADEDAVEIVEDAVEAEEVSAAIPEELAGLAELVQEFGGVAGLRETLSGIKANADQARADLVRQITANSDVWTEADLKSMGREQLSKLAATVRPADFSGSNRNPVVTNVSDWEDYQAPTA